jgi:hypothetical protein
VAQSEDGTSCARPRELKKRFQQGLPVTPIDDLGCLKVSGDVCKNNLRAISDPVNKRQMLRSILACQDICLSGTSHASIRIDQYCIIISPISKLARYTSQQPKLEVVSFSRRKEFP